MTREERALLSIFPEEPTPRRLPIVALVYQTRLRLFFADERLREYRTLNNPHLRLAIDEVEPADMAEVIRTAAVPVAVVK